MGAALLAFPWMSSPPPTALSSFLWGRRWFLGVQHHPSGQGIIPRGWTTHAAPSHPCQQPGWALGFPSGVWQGSASEHPAARRTSGALALVFFQWIWPSKGVGFQGGASWEAPALPGRGAGGFATRRIAPGSAPGCPGGCTSHPQPPIHRLRHSRASSARL